MINFQIIKRSYRYLLLITFFLFLIYNLFFSDFGYLKRWKLEREKKELLLKIFVEIEKQDSLYRLIRVLENDTLYIEKLARENFGLVK